MIVLLVALPANALADESGARLISQIMALHSDIDSIIFEVAQSEGDSTVHYRFAESGSMLRVDAFLETAPSVSSKPDLIYAYDGDRYQNYAQRTDTLSFSSNNRFPTPYGAINPLLLMFTWALPSKDSTWSTLKDVSVWEDIENRTTYNGTETLSGIECNVIEVAGCRIADGVVSSFTVYAPEAYGYFPVRIESNATDEGETWIIEANNFSSFSTRKTNLMLPCSITSRMASTGNRSTATNRQVLQWTLSEKTIDVNPAIAPETFTLPHDIAGTVDDYDRNMERLIKEGKLVGEGIARTRGFGDSLFRVVVAINLILVVGIVTWFTITKLKTRAS